MQPDQPQLPQEELPLKNMNETSTEISTPKESQILNSGVSTPRNRGFNSQEAIARAIQWGSNLTPTDLEYLDDQGSLSGIEIVATHIPGSQLVNSLAKARTHSRAC